jgi:hypothetical protein
MAEPGATSSTADKLRFFKANGYHVEHGVLSAAEVASVLGGIEDYQKGKRGIDDIELLHATTALDGLVYHPTVFNFCQSVLGQGAQVCSMSYSHRPAQLDLEPPADYDEGERLCLARAWHREDSGNIEGAEANEYFAPALQCFFYLDDIVEGESHCTSVIPESADTKRGKPRTRRPLERDGRKHDGLLRIDDYGPYGPVAEEWKTAVGGYISKERPTWVDAYGTTSLPGHDTLTDCLVTTVQGVHLHATCSRTVGHLLGLQLVGLPSRMP